MSTHTISPVTRDFGAIKKKQQATWASGDFAVIGTTLQIVGELLAEAADVRAGERVIDVAAANGNATLAAARRAFGRWTGPGGKSCMKRWSICCATTTSAAKRRSSFRPNTSKSWSAGVEAAMDKIANGRRGAACAGRL